MAAKQQINLYQDEFRQQEVAVSARQVTLGSIALIALLALVSGFQFWQRQDLQQQQAQLERQHAETNAKLTALRQKLDTVQPDEALQQQVDELARELSVKQQVMQVLSDKKFGNTTGFVEHFTGLARQRIDGLWLTGLHIDHGGVSLDMQGSSLKPEYVPHYIQRLSAEPVFAGTEFESMAITQNEERRRWVDFRLESQVKKVAN